AKSFTTVSHGWCHSERSPRSEESPAPWCVPQNHRSVQAGNSSQKKLGMTALQGHLRLRQRLCRGPGRLPEGVLDSHLRVCFPMTIVRTFGSDNGGAAPRDGRIACAPVSRGAILSLTHSLTHSLLAARCAGSPERAAVQLHPVSRTGCTDVG